MVPNDQDEKFPQLEQCMAGKRPLKKNLMQTQSEPDGKRDMECEGSVFILSPMELTLRELGPQYKST